MKTVQIVLDERLLNATDKVVKRQHTNRSAVVRDALRDYLKHLHTRELERREREGYLTHPDTEAELSGWEEVAAWPDD
jgi:metal-responsive CopG/Arc/MetJ family transcriptional regulator